MQYTILCVGKIKEKFYTDAVNEYKDYICNQVLGTSLELVDEVKDGTMLEFDDFSLFVNVIKD